MRGTTFVLYFHWAARRIADQGLSEVLSNSDGFGRSWQLREQVLNALVGGDSFPFVEDARFYLRADHVTFSARMSSSRDTYELLTVGQMERTGPASVQYRIEAIFIDGRLPALRSRLDVGTNHLASPCRRIAAAPRLRPLALD